MHLSSPLGYLLNACSPLALGLIAPFSNGYLIVFFFLKISFIAIESPDKKSSKNMVLKNLDIFIINLPVED